MYCVIFCRINVNDQGPERWTDLYSILAAEGRHMSKVEGDWHCLLEALEEAFRRDYGIPYPISIIIQDVANELVTNTKYTRYYTHQLDQNEVSNQFTKNMRSKHGKMLTELYIPAIANACNIWVNIISNIFGFVSSFNTIPEEISPATKVINLLWKDEKYSAVARTLDGVLPIPEEGPALHSSTSITIIPESQPVVVKDEPTEEPVSIPETQTSELNEVTSIPETQISSVNEDSSRKPEKEIFTIKQEPTSASNKTKGNQAVTEVIVITDSSDDTDDTIEELNTLLNKSPATIGKGRPLDMTLYKDFIPEVVDKIPHNIDGLHHYMIDCMEDENSLDWQKRYRDGRYFHLNSSRRKGFRGIRRIGHCKGNHICLNNECSYYLEKYQRNQHQFRSTGGSTFCFSCDCLASKIKCGAIKLIEFDQQKIMLQVCHQGKHQCYVKPNIHENDDYINQALEESGCAMGPRQLAF